MTAVEGAVGLWLIGWITFALADYLNLAGRSYLRRADPVTFAVMLLLYAFWPVFVLVHLIRRKFS